MNKIYMALIALATLGLVGCDDYVTPAGVVRTAAGAVYKNEVKTLQKALTGNALNQYGSRDGLGALRSKLSGLSGLRIEDAQFVSEKPVNNNGFQTAVRTWTVNVVAKASKEAKESRILTATVLCDIYELNTECNYAYRRGSFCNSMDSNEVTECKIAEIQ